MKSTKSIALVILSTLALGANAATNLVTNGSFEQNSQANGTWSTRGSLVGWTGQPTVELRNNVSGVAQDGVNFVELDTNRNSGISQTVNATGLVELSFWYSARPGTATTTNDIFVSFGNSFQTTVLHGVGNTTGTNQWQHFSQIIDLGKSGSAVLSFYARGVSDSYGGSLDNISVTAVPEPETYAMLLAGLGVMATIARRRKQKTT